MLLDVLTDTIAKSFWPNTKIKFLHLRVQPCIIKEQKRREQWVYCGLELNQDKSKCRALGPMYGENRHKTMMIPGKTKIFQRGLFEKIRFENFKFNFHPLGVAA